MRCRPSLKSMPYKSIKSGECFRFISDNDSHFRFKLEDGSYVDLTNGILHTSPLANEPAIKINCEVVEL